MNLPSKVSALGAVLAAAVLLAACRGESEPGETPIPPSPSPTTVVVETPPPAPRLVIHEVMPKAEEGDFPWVELANLGDAPAPLAGAVLRNEDGDTFQLPDQAPDLRPGDYVLILYDGEGPSADDYEPADNRITLHTAQASPQAFDETGDQLALYGDDSGDPEALLDFIAWGARPGGLDAEAAMEAGIWQPGMYLASERGGLVSGLSQPGQSIGLLPGQPPGQIDSWVVYAAFNTSPGAANNVPTPAVLLPPSQAVVPTEFFSLSWYNVPNARSYQLQMDDDPDFSSPEVDLRLEEPIFTPEAPPPDGVYHWRVKALTAAQGEGPFSSPAQITLVTLEPLALPEPPIEGFNPPGLAARPTGLITPLLGRLLPGGSLVSASSLNAAFSLFSPAPSSLIPPGQGTSYWQVDYINRLRPILQRKDSKMICWDGDKEVGTRQPWDGPHADTPGNHSPHGQQNCARASAAMVNDYYGGDLTQDRLSYFLFGGDNWPAADLGHNTPTQVAQVSGMLSWSLNGVGVRTQMGKPSFAQIQAWTTARQPVLAAIPGHAIVLRGWAIYNGPSPDIPRGTRFVFYNDPWTGDLRMARYDSFNLFVTWATRGSPSGRKLEQSLKEDPDGDGILSFDESQRFKSDPRQEDTDQDCINDKEDMHSFLYRPHDTYNRTLIDIDGDSKWVYLDADNDNGGVIDGEEDANRNGHPDGSESNNFIPTDDRASAPCRPTPTPTPTEPSGLDLPQEAEISIALQILYDPAGHNPFIGMPASLRIRMRQGSISFEGPHPWVGVSGEVDQEGNFQAAGVGTVAGFPNIRVTFSGTITPESLSGEYTMGANGGLPGGQAITYGVEGTLRPVSPGDAGEQPAEGPAAVSPPSTDQVARFFDLYNKAITAGDRAWLLGRLARPVLEIYGTAACREHMGRLIAGKVNIELLQVGQFGSWTFARDGWSYWVDNVVTAPVNVTFNGETQQTESHLALSPEGFLTWFTDCGDPLP